MAKLNVLEIGNNTVEYGGGIYEKATHPIREGDIVKALERDLYFTRGSYYLVKGVDNHDDFSFEDDENDERERDIEDEEFIPYRKVATKPETFLDKFPPFINIVINGNVTINLETEARLDEVTA